MILVVTGGRRYPWSMVDDELLDHLIDFLGVTEIWHGGALGVDEAAAGHARARGLGVRVFLPQPALIPEQITWELVRRNATMMDALAAAVHHERRRGTVGAWPGGEGTANAVSAAIRRSLHVIDLRMRIFPQNGSHG